VQDLAEASHDDVLSAWKGLGYYSRATRLHEGAKAMIAKFEGSPCVLPSSATELQQFPGIGRYTAGAVSSIAFGEPEPVLDGNVARVLSRQLGLYIDIKDKKATDILWDQADQVIKHVSTMSGSRTSSIPGQWNQALMELGSTVCTPKPRCEGCPIQKTCRVYGEGQALFDKDLPPIILPDIEDACGICDTLDIEDLETAPNEAVDDEPPQIAKKQKGNARQSNTISNYFAIGTPKSSNEIEDEEDNGGGVVTLKQSRKRKISTSPGVAKQVASYCALFPKKVARKKAAEEECTVCIIELCTSDASSKWLIEQRPAKGMF
jgi:A/G-specific adenine glycosylase